MTAKPLLGVERSLTGRRWFGPTLEQERHALLLQQRLGLSPPLAAVLTRQGIAEHHVEAWLAPTLKQLLPDPLLLKDMEAAATRILHAAQHQQRVAVFADYDVDGACSAALLILWFRHFGVEPTLYVPDRIAEGYGPNRAAMDKLSANHDLIVLVDCGTTAHDAIDAARGTDVVILDHHQALETLPHCLAAVNPNRQDESGDQGMLCAAGVVFMVLVQLRRLLREQDQTGPDLMQLLDLVALATVADVAPLTGVNRAFVRQGLKVMANTVHPGVDALKQASQTNGPITAMTLGFAFAPRINAGGRIGRSDLGARLLTARDSQEARAIADKLGQLNSTRREMEAAQTAEALAQAEKRGFTGPLVWAAATGWHPGIIGITSAKLKEAAHRPSMVIALDGSVGKGSGRSVPGIDLGAAVAKLRMEGLLENGGGHAMAAGLTVEATKLEQAMSRLAELLAKQGADQMGPAALSIDHVMLGGDVDWEMIAELDRAGPFGAASPEPCIMLADQRIKSTRVIGANHLKIQLVGSKLEVLAFGALDTPLGALAEAKRAPVHLAGSLSLNHWQGRVTPQLRLIDAAWA